MKRKKPPIYPKSKIKLEKLWPYARKQGHEIGQIYEVGYYAKKCGLDIIWLTRVNDKDKLDWTIDEPFLKKHFIVIEESKERKAY